MSNNNCTIIEIVADYIFFVVTGTDSEIKNYIKNMKNNDKNIYISLKIDKPIVNELSKLEKLYNKKIIIETGSESAQSFAFAQDSYIIKSKNFSISNDNLNKKTHMLMILENLNSNKMILKYPKLELHDDDDPEVVVMNWVLNSNDIKNNFIIKNIKKTIKPLTLVGYRNDILVYSANI
jgi:hypothetical protein